MKDKRTLLAFLSIGLIFLLLPFYFEWMGLNPNDEKQRPEYNTINDPRYSADNAKREAELEKQHTANFWAEVNKGMLLNGSIPRKSFGVGNWSFLV